MITLKTLDEVVQSMINNIYDKLPSADTKEGTFLRDVFIDPTADEIDALNIDMKMMEYNQSILTATGQDLDRLATNYNVSRKTATPATGIIRFYIKNVNMDFIINANTQLSTAPTYSEEARIYETINTRTVYYIHDKNNPPIDISNEEVLAIYMPIYQNNLKLDSSGYYYYDMNAKSVKGGSFYNITSNTITKQVSNLDSNIQSFTNPTAFTGGTDKEKDTDLVMRIKLALQGANIGTKYGYLNYVLKQDGVEAAQVVAAMDEDMIRDITEITEYYANNTLVHDGGKVDIYVKGAKTEQQNARIFVTPDDIQMNEEGWYSNLIIDTTLKPITRVNSVSYQTEDGFGILTNSEDYEREVTYARFVSFEDFDKVNLTPYMKEAIENFFQDPMDLDIYTLEPTRKYNLTGENVRYAKTYELTYQYVVNDSEDLVLEDYPMIVSYYINDLNNIIFTTFLFEVPTGDTYYEIANVAVCYIKDMDSNNFYFYRNARSIGNEDLVTPLQTVPIEKYYVDIPYKTDLLFPNLGNGDTVEGVDADILYLWQSQTQEQLGLQGLSIQPLYTRLHDVQEKLMFAINNYMKKLSNFEYNVDLAAAQVNKYTIYTDPTLYGTYREEDGYAYIDVKVTNNPNIHTITFKTTIVNENAQSPRIDFNNITWNDEAISGDIDENIYTYIFNNIEIDTNVDSDYILIGTFKAPILNEEALTVSFSNIIMQNLIGNVLINNVDSISVTDTIMQFNEDSITNIMYYIYEYVVGTDIYKYEVELPVILIDEDTVNIIFTFTKVNDTLQLRVYYTPDFTIVNTNQTLYGNSQDAHYRIKWFRNPLTYIGGNIYLNISFETNALIRELQEGIEQVKCLTADVLIKEAEKYPIEIIADVHYDESYSETETYGQLVNAVTNYVNNSCVMGGTLKVINIINVMQKVEGVIDVDITTFKLRRMYGDNQKSISIHKYEYFKLENLVLNKTTD